MTAMSTLVPALKRELAVPGTFETIFPDTFDADLVAALADGFSEAQLNDFFPDVALNPRSDDWITDPDLSGAGAALVIIFTSMRFIRAQLRNLATVERYKAGAAEYEIQRAATLLKAELDYLQKRLDDLVAASRRRNRASTGLATVFDNYLARTAIDLGGMYRHEYKAG